MVNSAIILELYPSQLRSYRLVPHQYQCSSLVPECKCCPIQLPPLTHKVLSANTLEPLLKDSPNKGHHINYLPTKTLSKAPIVDFPIVLIHFPPLKSGQPLYSGQICWSQCVLYKEAPLYTYTDYGSFHGCCTAPCITNTHTVYPILMAINFDVSKVCTHMHTYTYLHTSLILKVDLFVHTYQCCI